MTNAVDTVAELTMTTEAQIMKELKTATTHFEIAFERLMRAERFPATCPIKKRGLEKDMKDAEARYNAALEKAAQSER